jgi:hypothetical protein
MKTFQVRPVPNNNRAIERQPGFAAVPCDESIDGEFVAPPRMDRGERV